MWCIQNVKAISFMNQYKIVHKLIENDVLFLNLNVNGIAYYFKTSIKLRMCLILSQNSGASAAVSDRCIFSINAIPSNLIGTLKN